MKFQYRVAQWMTACFGPVISADVTERNHRFLEEALELVQAKGCTASEAAETELLRAWEIIDKIRAKAAAKPKYSPLPQ